MTMSDNPCKYFSNFTSNPNATLDPCAIGVFAAGGGTIVFFAILVMCISILCCCKRRRKRKLRHDKETNVEGIRLTTIKSNSENDEEVTKKANNKERNDHRSVTGTNEGKKTSSKKMQKPPHNDSTDKKGQLSEQRTNRTASEGASGKNLPYKQAQSKGSSTSRETSDFQRSVSVSAMAGAKPREHKRLPDVPTTSEKSNKAEDKSSQHGYDNVKGAEENAHKYANVELSNSTLEPKYDEVDKESTKKNQKESDRNSKGKAKDNDHYYHTLEDSERVNAEPTNDEEYSSPKSKSLVVTKGTVQDKQGGKVLTEENATVKESGATKSKRAKSCSGKKSSKDEARRNHEYEEPSHNTLPHHQSTDKKESMMQAGKLTLVFDDPMYSASTEIPISKSVQLVPVKASSPKHKGSEAPILRNPEKSRKQGKDEPEYDQPAEKSSRMTKDDLYSSRLFDDPKYEDTQP